MVLDVPCSVCVDCDEILECWFDRGSAIEAATMKADGTRDGFSIEAQPRSQTKRNAWNGVFMNHALQSHGIFCLDAKKVTYNASL